MDKTFYQQTVIIHSFLITKGKYAIKQKHNYNCGKHNELLEQMLQWLLQQKQSGIYSNAGNIIKAKSKSEKF